jgi:ABC-2 type transport system ATP-binding protein
MTVQISKITKRYGTTLAIRDLSIHFPKEGTVAIMGPSGCGKTTLLQMLAGLQRPNQGTLQCNARSTAYVFQEPRLLPWRTVADNIRLARCQSSPPSRSVEEWLLAVGLPDCARRYPEELSGGMKQRVGIAQALIGNPDLLILDEPTVGLDPKQIIEIRNLIARLGKNHTVILSSHILSEIQEVCERIIIINRGKIIADDTPDNLSKNLSDDHSIQLRVKGTEAELHKILGSVPGIKEYRCIGSKEEGSFDFVIEPKPGCDIRGAISDRMSERKKTILSLRSGEMTLEQIFLRLTDAADKGASLFVKNEEVLEKTPEETVKIKFDPETGTATVGEATDTQAEYGSDKDEEDED